MKWKDTGDIVAIVAPLFGKALASSSGESAGAILASEFGVKNDPVIISKIVVAAPDVGKRLKEIEKDYQKVLARIVLEAELKKLIESNKNMRSETKPERWPQYSWRPFIGFCTGISFVLVSGLCCTLAFDAVKSGSFECLAIVPQMVGSFSALFAIPGAILGVSAWHRGKEKILERQDAGIVEKK